ncbi:subtilisin-like serine protease [Beauveria brongniartii RCEF 3172]|uniref:Subtilisin-like serine protease n=1 Tax=Beauveria brongniartii RCEF 3172 TaxID=1081107 RepID=A0A167BIC2_9HYPO|nr:subtilisin-like serine protease [Beauveria brongniartii RCEF 3172]
MTDYSAVQPANSAGSDVPFTTLLFTRPPRESEPEPSSTTASEETIPFDQKSDYLPLFPASFRTGKYREEIRPVDQDSLGDFLKQEFSLKRLYEIHSKLWRVGYKRAPRSLTAQLLQGRRIVLAESLDMHLVWDSGKIYIKPLPRYLLEPAIWRRHLSKQGQTPLGAEASAPVANGKPSEVADTGEIRKAALGLLYSYACLIADRTDFELALQEGLLPKVSDPPSWPRWRALATELLRSQMTGEMHPRFKHGELRLGRLNWIYLFKDIPEFKLYFDPWNSYTEFVFGNMASITAVTVYMVVVLTAMQVGLATNKLKENASFHSASYGFAVFSILAPLIAGLLIVVALLVVLVPNWKSARAAVVDTATDTASSGSPVGSLGGQDVTKANQPAAATVTARCLDGRECVAGSGPRSSGGQGRQTLGKKFSNGEDGQV